MKYFYYINRTLPKLDKDGSIPEWIQLVPVGEFPITRIVEEDGKKEKKTELQIVDQSSISAMAKSFQGPALLDFDHESYEGDKRTTAAGWIIEVEGRGEEGLWGKIDWSDSGQAAIKGKEYRYISPVFPEEGVESLGEGKIRPIQMESAALTNWPNMEKIHPIFNKAFPSDGGSKTKNTTNTMDYKAILIQVLGLDPTATDEQIDAARQALSNRLKNIDEEKKELIEEILDLQLEGEEFTDQEEEEAIKEVLRTNRKAGAVILKNRRAAVGAAVKSPRQALTNRQPAKTPTGNPTDAQDAASHKRAAAIRNRAAEIMSRERISYGAAFNRASAELEN